MLAPSVSAQSAATPTSNTASSAIGSRPNVILIVADDLGYRDLAPYGQTLIQTPNIARMANESIVFTDFYSGSPVCAPARCTLMLGKDTGACSARGNFNMPMRGTDETVAEYLKRSGYVTGIFGKWALGGAGTDSSPLAQGFDYTFGWMDQRAAHNSFPDSLWASAGDKFTDGLPAAGAQLAQVPMHGSYAPDVVLDQAVAFLRQAGDEPLFLYYPTTIPHANNKNETTSTAFLEVPSLGIYADKPWAKGERQYAALVSKFDAHVETLRKAAMALDRPTVIFITADNGPHNLGGSNTAFFGSTGPFRGFKGRLLEGGIRVPLLIWTTDGTGQIDQRPSSFPDLTATIVALAGQEVPETMTGRDLLGDNSAIDDSRALYWEFHGGAGGKWAVRKGRWKTMAVLSTPFEQAVGSVLRLGAARFDDQPGVELYDLVVDPGEANNLAEARPDIVTEHFAIAAKARKSAGFGRELDLFRTRENIDKWVVTRFVSVCGAVLALFVLVALFWRRRRKAAV